MDYSDFIILNANNAIIKLEYMVKEDPYKVIDVIKYYYPDIICLQEITQNYYRQGFKDIPKILGNELGYDYLFGVAQIFNKKDQETLQGNIILSKFKFEQNKKIFLKESGGPNLKDYYKEGRIYLETTFKIGSFELKVSNVHLSTSINRNKEISNRDERQKLLDIISKNKDDNYILCGDFNVDENSKLIKSIENYLYSLGPSYSKKTWTTKPFQYKEQILAP